VPAYMIPAAVVSKDDMPRTASGKTDLRALAAEAAALVGAAVLQRP
jgi:acyl-coenzyme A synthetase/AMP-(fatty) acid ligase